MLKKVISDESGRIIVWTIVALALGALLIPPFMTRISAGFLATRAVEEGLKEQYAADAGVEYALYKIANDDYPEGPFGIPTAMNGMTITVTVEKRGIYRVITSTAGSTVIGSDVEYAAGGNLEIYRGALVSETDIRLFSDTEVDGDISVGEGYTLTVSYPFTHTGGSVIEQETEFPPSGDFADTFREEALEGGTHNGDMTISQNSQIDLGPLYITGDLKVRMNSVITLTGTIFVEGGGNMAHDIDTDQGSEFRGEGSIVAVGDIYIQKVADFGTSTEAVPLGVPGDNGILDIDRADAAVDATADTAGGCVIGESAVVNGQRAAAADAAAEIAGVASKGAVADTHRTIAVHDAAAEGGSRVTVDGAVADAQHPSAVDAAAVLAVGGGAVGLAVGDGDVPQRQVTAAGHVEDAELRRAAVAAALNGSDGAVDGDLAGDGWQAVGTIGGVVRGSEGVGAAKRQVNGVRLPVAVGGVDGVNEGADIAGNVDHSRAGH